MVALLMECAEWPDLDESFSLGGGESGYAGGLLGDRPPSQRL
jgi:hypothetical protein